MGSIVLYIVRLIPILFPSFALRTVENSQTPVRDWVLSAKMGKEKRGVVILI